MFDEISSQVKHRYRSNLKLLDTDEEVSRLMIDKNKTFISRYDVQALDMCLRRKQILMLNEHRTSLIALDRIYHRLCM